MDTEKVIELLEWWSKTAEAARGTHYNARYQVTTKLASISGDHKSLPELRDKEDQVRRVLKHVLHLKTLPVVLERSGDYYEVMHGIAQATYALGRLRNEVETRTLIGSTAPTMQADALHPLIWGAAQKHWDVGHYAVAVQRAATDLSGHIKDRVERYDVGDAALVQQAFSLEPPKLGQSRLHWPGASGSLDVKSRRLGVLHLAQAVYSGLRNITTHDTDEVAQQEALEQLAALSLLARWVDQCELVKA